eukprot:4314666-Pyramimonas_sp.AAC.1
MRCFPPALRDDAVLAWMAWALGQWRLAGLAFLVVAVPLFGAVALKCGFQFMWCILCRVHASPGRRCPPGVAGSSDSGAVMWCPPVTGPCRLASEHMVLSE